MKGLTEKQRKMLEFIEDFMNKSSMAPTVYEIADNFKIKTSTVFAHLRALQRKNHLTRSSKARSISLTKPRRKMKRFLASNPTPVPIIGGAGAGELTGLNCEADGARHRDLLCDPALIGGLDASQTGLFALRIKGHGLRDIGILDGDIVVAKPSLSIKRGDLVVSSIGNENVIQRQALDFQPMAQMGGIKGVVIALQRKI